MLSPGRKLDMLAIVLIILGLLTLISMLMPGNSALTASWVGLMGNVMGVGMYAFPFALIIGGIWIVLRNFKRIPQLPAERIVGFVLLFLWVLTLAHFIVARQNGLDTFDLASQGKGGGFLGALVYWILDLLAGPGGTLVVMMGWLLIALVMALDVTLAQMITYIPLRLQQRLKRSPSASRLSDPSPVARMGPVQRLQARFSKKKEPELDWGGEMPVPVPEPASQAAPASLPAGENGLAGAEAVVQTWVLPPIAEILDKGEAAEASAGLDDERARIIEEALASFGAPGHVVEISRGPTITQFGVEPDYVESRGGRMKVRVGKILSLDNDLALALSARSVRIQAPVPGKNYVGIEVPNEAFATVTLRDVIESEAFARLQSPLRFALGLNVSGVPVAANLASMPHLLIAGATGSGKSVCVNALICCLLANNTPDDLRLIMVDPKRVELTGYNGIPHLLSPVVVELERVVSVLQWVTREMDMRYRKLADAGARNILEYNNQQLGQGGRKLPYLVVIIDELADLMMLAPDETERSITRLAQLARATGIHLVIATQRPSVDVVTGLIKANLPARIAFAVASGMDSRVILDQTGAEALLGRGDMLFQAPDAPAPVRLQGVYVSDSEILRLVTYWQTFAGIQPPAPSEAGGVIGDLPSGVPLKQMPLWDDQEEEEGDPLLKEAIDLSRRQGRASISMLQRRLRIGYTRAARLIEEMEEKGIVGPPEPSTGAREILDYGPAGPPVEEMRE